jgi:hypothetical protein
VPELGTKHFAYLTLGAGVLVLIIAFSTPVMPFKTIATIFAAIMVPLSFALWKWGYIFIPYLTKRANIIEVHDGGWELTPAQDAIVKKIGDNYYASVFLHLKMYKSTTERSAEENVLYTEAFERAIAQIKYPIKIGTVLFAREISKYREDLETKRYEAQLKLQREREKPEPDVITLDRLEKEVAMYEAQLTRIATGERPMGLIAYAMTTAVGVTKDAAVAVAKNQAAEIKTLLANALNIEVGYLYGEDMRKCYEMEMMIPPTVKEAEAFVEA